MVQELSRRGAVAAGFGIAAMAWSARATQAISILARTRHGPIRGYVDDRIFVFRGVRYGADTAPRRFQPPAPPAPWTEVADAERYGPASPQRDMSAGPTSEDCLFLNVWTPGLDAGRRPVMVYVHGGAYSNGSGSAPLYDGVRLCKRGDVVVVTLNHRLNVFGYGYLARLVSDLPDSGNTGQRDLILALRWVRDNIAGFGGDPDKVMVFGQSGGGAKIATLMATPLAAGLFHRAATMSGQQVTASGPGNATRRTLAFLDALKLRPDQAADLRTLPAERLVEALAVEDPVLGFGGLYFGPVVDERSLQRHPFYPDAPAQSARIPMIIGNTRDETRAFLGNDPANFSLTWDSLPAKLNPANMRVDIDPATVIAEYRRLYPAYSPSDVMFAATTAARSWRGAIIEAEERAEAGHPTWAYQLDYPAAGDRLRAAHASDIQLVFDNLARPGAAAIGPEAQAVADQMSEAFLAFARTGDPNARAIPTWEPYDLAHRRTMVFDTRSRLIDDPRGGERRLFEKVPFVQAGT